MAHRARRALVLVAGLSVFVLLGLVAAGASTRAAAAVRPAAASSTSGPQLVQATGATETTAATALTATFPASTAGGHLLVLAASVYTGTANRITAVTDSAGRSWTRIGTYSASGHNSDGELWYSANAPAVTSVTAQTKSSAVMAMSVLEFSGVIATSPLDAAAVRPRPTRSRRPGRPSPRVPTSRSGSSPGTPAPRPSR